jgi:hypothetical protein
MSGTQISSLEFTQQVYLESRGVSAKGVPIMEPKHLDTRVIQYTGIMNLLEIPHFGRGREVNKCQAVTSSDAWRHFVVRYIGIH